MKRFVAKLEQDENGVWCGSVKLGKAGAAYSDGPTIERAQARLREAVALGLDCEPEEVEIELDVKLGASVKRALKAAKEAASGAEDAHRKALAANQSAARALLDSGLSLRDVGSLLGVTRQRVGQIVAGTKERAHG